MQPLLLATENGIYCPQGDFYIDPIKPVKRAVITHAHSDHARAGHAFYLCQTDTAPLLKLRLGDQIHTETLDYGVKTYIQGVELNFFPAGHVIGSAQIRLAYRGQTWVVSGDYKVVDDGITPAFEPVRCHVFITESTFGLPIYRWAAQSVLQSRIQQWIWQTLAQQQLPILVGYSLGKAQRLLYLLKDETLNFWLHPSIYHIHQTLLQHRPELQPYFPFVQPLNPDVKRAELQQSLILIPPAALETKALERLQPYATGYCSGWMQVHGQARQRKTDAAFPLSDHADWPGLISAVEATGAEKVWVTHGFTHSLARYLREEKKLDADVWGLPAFEDETEE